MPAVPLPLPRFEFHWRLVPIFVVLVLVVAVRSPAVDKPEGLVIRSTTRLVQMSVVVQDEEGRPVTDLKKEDFEVLDNGKKRPISIFVAETPTIATTSHSLPPDVFTNQFAQTQGARSGYAVVLLDWLNTSWTDQAQSRQQAVKMLQKIGPDDRVSLCVLDRRLRVITDFTSDRSLLLKKLAALRGDSHELLDFGTASFSDVNISLSDQDRSERSRQIGAGLGNEEDAFLLVRRVLETLQAFEEIANHLANVPGRKTLIWVSTGFPSSINERVIEGTHPDESTYNSNIWRAIHALNNADVAVYSIDAEGFSSKPNAKIKIPTLE